MFDIETLRAADIYEWVGSEMLAGFLTNCNQSTISRKLKAIREFQKRYSAYDSDLLLQMEREVHQHWRFKKEAGLRVHMYKWTNSLMSQVLPHSWLANPLMISETVKCPIELLEKRMIEAVCAPYPMVAKLDKCRFSIIPIFSTKLVVLADNNSNLWRDVNLTDTDIKTETQYAALDFVPRKTSNCSKEIDDQLFCATAEESVTKQKRYWGTSLMQIAKPSLRVLDYETNTMVGEFLVVLREWASHGCTLQLLEFLTKNLGSASSAKGYLPSIEIIQSF